MRQLMKPIVIAIVSLLVVVGVAGPAYADHVVSWGADSSDGPRQIIAAESPTRFVVNVSFDGNPMSGWPMTVVTSDATGETISRQDIVTDAGGSAEFTIEAPPPGDDVTVELCDDDGCLYGEATISGAAPATTTTPPATSAAPATTAATAPPPGPAVNTGDDGGNGGWWVLIGIGVLVGILGLVLLGGTFLSPKRPKPWGDPEWVDNWLSIVKKGPQIASAPDLTQPVDWGAYAYDGKEWKTLRKPKGQEIFAFYLRIVSHTHWEQKGESDKVYFSSEAHGWKSRAYTLDELVPNPRTNGGNFPTGDRSAARAKSWSLLKGASLVDAGLQATADVEPAEPGPAAPIDGSLVDIRSKATVMDLVRIEIEAVASNSSDADRTDYIAEGTSYIDLYQRIRQSDKQVQTASMSSTGIDTRLKFDLSYDVDSPVGEDEIKGKPHRPGKDFVDSALGKLFKDLPEAALSGISAEAPGVGTALKTGLTLLGGPAQPSNVSRRRRRHGSGTIQKAASTFRTEIETSGYAMSRIIAPDANSVDTSVEAGPSTSNHHLDIRARYGTAATPRQWIDGPPDLRLVVGKPIPKGRTPGANDFQPPSIAGPDAEIEVAGTTSGPRKVFRPVTDYDFDEGRAGSMVQLMLRNAFARKGQWYWTLDRIDAESSAERAKREKDKRDADDEKFRWEQAQRNAARLEEKRRKRRRRR